MAEWVIDPDCDIYLSEAKRAAKASQRSTPIRDGMIFSRVAALRKQGLSIRKACEKIAGELHRRDAKMPFMWDSSDPDFDLSVAIRNSYNKHKHRLKNDVPRPYYGSDITVKPHES